MFNEGLVGPFWLSLKFEDHAYRIQGFHVAIIITVKHLDPRWLNPMSTYLRQTPDISQNGHQYGVHGTKHPLSHL